MWKTHTSKDIKLSLHFPFYSHLLCRDNDSSFLRELYRKYYSKSVILSHTSCMTRSLTFSIQPIFLFVFYVRQCNAICNVNIAMQCFLLWAWQCFDCAAMKEFCFFSDKTVEVSELGQAQLLQNQRSMGSAAYCVQRRIS